MHVAKAISSIFYTTYTESTKNQMQERRPLTTLSSSLSTLTENTNIMKPQLSGDTATPTMNYNPHPSSPDNTSADGQERHLKMLGTPHVLQNNQLTHTTKSTRFPNLDYLSETC